MASPARETANRKTERIELRVTPSVREVIQRASAISGLTPGDLAYQTALRIVEEHEVLHLRGEAACEFADALLNPPQPADALTAAFRRHDHLAG